MTSGEYPVAYCPLNDVEAWGFPFYIKRGAGVEGDQLLLEVHLWHLTAEERAAAGKLLRIGAEEDLEDAGYTKDDRGVYIVGEAESWFPGPGNQF